MLGYGYLTASSNFIWLALSHRAFVHCWVVSHQESRIPHSQPSSSDPHPSPRWKCPTVQPSKHCVQRPCRQQRVLSVCIKGPISCSRLLFHALACPKVSQYQRNTLPRYVPVNVLNDEISVQESNSLRNHRRGVATPRSSGSNLRGPF